MSTVDIDKLPTEILGAAFAMAVPNDAKDTKGTELGFKYEDLVIALAQYRQTLKAELLAKVENKTFWVGDEPCITKDNLTKIVNEL